MSERDDFDMLCNAVALIYHEGRNARHLIRAGLLDEGRWRYLVSLPANRDDAWREIAPIRQKALAAPSADAALMEFESRFHVSLQDLADMYANENWRHAKLYGGNAWALIVGLTVKLAIGLRSGNAAVGEIVAALKGARHNTGSFSEKLDRLEHARARSEEGV
jgi:hypothetical protein